MMNASGRGGFFPLGIAVSGFCCGRFRSDGESFQIDVILKCEGYNQTPVVLKVFLLKKK